MSSYVQAVAAVSPDRKKLSRSKIPFSLPKLHIFQNEGRTFVFNPATVRVVEIDKDEELYIKAIQDDDHGILKDFSPGSNPEKNVAVQNGLNKKLAGKQTTQDETVSEDTLYEVEIMVNASQLCNLSCGYCFVKGGQFSYTEPREQFVSKKHIEKLVHALPQAFPLTKSYNIHFYGGEPLLNLSVIKHCVDTVQDLNDDRFSMTITTNGTVVTDEVMAVLGRGRFDIVLSIDGPARIHDTLRRTHDDKPSHALVMEFLQRVKNELNLTVRGSSVVRHGWSLKSASAYLKTLPVDLIKAQAIRIERTHPLALTEQERRDYVAQLFEIAEEVKKSIDAETYPKDDRFKGIVLQLMTGIKRQVFCGAGKSLFGMSAEGQMLVCALLAGIGSAELGSVDDPEHKWVEKGLRYRKLFESKKACHECWALPLCGGGCFAMQSACGDVDCEFMRGTCEGALKIFASFYQERPQDLLILAGIMGDEFEI